MDLEQIIGSRVNSPFEKLEEMRSHKGICKHCNGVVKMLRHPYSGELLPDRCFCVYCGQRYSMDIKDLDKWEIEQWKQKSLDES